MSPRSRQERLSKSDRRHFLKLKSVLYDRVTGLPAFPVLLDELRGWLDERRQIGVLHLEIENLDLVESLYGWQVFDRILARVADLVARDTDTELPRGCRVGLNSVAGDRFAIFVPEQPGGAEVVAEFLDHVADRLGERLERAFQAPEFVGLSPKLRFRIGHSQLSLDPFYRFERRVYASLDQARGLFERRHRRQSRGLDEELIRIIRGAELETWFQPVFDLQTRDVIGHEAFARGPKDGPFESPGAMFAASDRLGVAADLDRACRESALLASAGSPPGPLFLNALPVSFETREGEDPQLARLAEDPHEVILEFPARAADRDPDGFVETLNRVKSGGFRIAIDDLGTGYSGQEVLERLEPDYLKLDLSLVRGIDRNLIKQEILASLIRIANRMGASVIAEGIETEAEASVLLREGARYGQGYLLAVPAPRIERPAERPGRGTPGP